MPTKLGQIKATARIVQNKGLCLSVNGYRLNLNCSLYSNENHFSFMMSMPSARNFQWCIHGIKHSFNFKRDGLPFNYMQITFFRTAFTFKRNYSRSCHIRLNKITWLATKGSISTPD